VAGRGEEESLKLSLVFQQTVKVVFVDQKQQISILG